MCKVVEAIKVKIPRKVKGKDTQLERKESMMFLKLLEKL